MQPSTAKPPTPTGSSAPPAPITERELRGATRDYLAGRAASDGGRIYEEFAVELGSARVDFAFVSDRLEAFELKSDFDDFSRLHNQIHAYNRSFEQITIITGAVFAEAVLRVVPSWWGILVASRDPVDDGVRLQTVRVASANAIQTAASLSMLLWRDEAIDVLSEKAGELAARRATRHQLREQLIEALGLEELRRAVTKHLRARSVTPTTAATSQKPGGDLSHHDANCLDFRLLT